MVDFGIDWQTILQNENVPLLFITPFFDEAGWLFQASGALWPGRVRSGELTAYGKRLCAISYDYRRRALAWAAGGLYVQTLSHAPNVLLGMSAQECMFRAPDNLAKQPELVPPLLMTAQFLVAACCRELSSRWREQEVAHKLEDELEILSEAPCFGSNVTVDVAALVYAQNRALLRCCHLLASQGAGLRYRWLTQNGDSEAGHKGDSLFSVWSGQTDELHGRSLEAFRSYLIAIGRTEALVTLDTGAYDYLHRFEYYLSEGELEIAEHILRDMIRLLLAGLHEPSDRAELPQLDAVVRRLSPTHQTS